jgi:hypothetical protein
LLIKHVLEAKSALANCKSKMGGKQLWPLKLVSALHALAAGSVRQPRPQLQNILERRALRAQLTRPPPSARNAAVARASAAPCEGARRSGSVAPGRAPDRPCPSRLRQGAERLVLRLCVKEPTLNRCCRGASDVAARGAGLM